MKPTLKRGKPKLSKTRGNPANDLAKAWKAMSKIPAPPTVPRFSSKWEEGAKAARTGLKITACPYDPSVYDYVTWLNGFAFAKHSMTLGDPLF